MNSFKIMSLNLLTSGANIPGNPPFNIRIKAISSMLEEYTPDIIGVQELTDSMFPYLKDILNNLTIYNRVVNKFSIYGCILNHQVINASLSLMIFPIYLVVS